MAYTDVFTGSSTSPSDVSYLALAPAGSSTTQLTWPELDGTTPFSRIIRVTPGGASAVIKLPAANLRGPGEDVLFQNVGSDTLAVQDYDGTEVATVAAGTAKYIYLTDNSTDHGAWAAVAFGSGSSATDASQVAGYGMDVVNSKLVVDFAVSANTSGVTVTTTDRGKAFVFTAGSVTMALPSVAMATDGFYFGVRNSGTGTVTVDPNGAELVDGASTLAMAPGESALIVCSGAAWYSYGYGRSVAFAITQLTKDLTGLTTYTITAAEAANKMVKFIGSLTANCTVTVPDAASVYFLQNATSVAAAETVTVKTSAGSGVTLSTGDRQVVYSDGTNVVSATTTTVTAPASVPAGTEGGPSLYFSTDTDTGFYLAGTNSFGITAGGTKRFEVSSTAATSVVPVLCQSTLEVTGNSTFTGTAQHNGAFAVGTTPQTYYGIAQSGTLGNNGGVAYAHRVTNTFGSGTTTAARGVSIAVATQAASFTCADLQSLRIDAPTIGSGSSVTTAYGALIAACTGATTNIALALQQTSGATNWNLYSSGTAKNYFNGSVLIGSSTDNGYKLEVTGTTNVTGTLTANTVGITSGGLGVTGGVTVTTGDVVVSSGKVTAQDIELSGGPGNTYTQCTNGGASWEFGAKTDGTGYIFTSASEVFTVEVGGNSQHITSTVGFYPTADNTKSLGLNSNRWSVVYAGNGTIQTSDKRRKDHVDEIKEPGSVIDALQPVRFKWKQTGLADVGFYAQDVAPLIPEATVKGTETVDWGFLPDRLIPFLVAEIQSLRRRVAKLESK